MAKIIVVGDACVVKSEVKLEDLQKVAANRPDVLILRDESNKESPKVVFRVAVSDNPKASGINQNGATFARTENTGSGKAQITMPVCCGGEDVKEHVAARIGNALMYLNQIEERIPDALEAIDAEHQAILDSIELQ